MKQSWIRKGFLLGLAFFMLVGASSCNQNPKKGGNNDNTKKGAKLSWTVEGADASVVVVKADGKIAKSGNNYAEGAKVSFEVKVPDTHKFEKEGWKCVGATIVVDEKDHKKASFDMGKEDVLVTITLKKIEYRVSWKLNANDAQGAKLDVKVNGNKIENATETKCHTGDKVELELTYPEDTHYLEKDAWYASGANLKKDGDKKANLVVAKGEVEISVTLTNKLPKVSWELDAGQGENEAKGVKLVVQKGGSVIESGLYHKQGDKIEFELQGIPDTHEILKSGWHLVPKVGTLTPDETDLKKASLTVGEKTVVVKAVLSKKEVVDTTKKQKVTFKIEPAGIQGASIEAKIGETKINSGEEQERGKEIVFTVTIPATHQASNPLWTCQGGTITSDKDNPKKAKLVLGEQDVVVTANLTEVPKDQIKVSYKIKRQDKDMTKPSSDDMQACKVVMSVDGKTIDNGAKVNKKSTVKFVVDNIKTGYELRSRSWSAVPKLDDITVDKSKQFKEATIVLGENDEEIIITVYDSTIPKTSPTLIWDDKKDAVGYTLKAKVNGQDIQPRSQHPVGTEVTFKVEDVPTTHEIVSWTVTPKIGGEWKDKNEQATERILVLGDEESVTVSVGVRETETGPKYTVSYNIVPESVKDSIEVTMRANGKKANSGSSHSKGVAIEIEVDNDSLPVKGFKTYPTFTATGGDLVNDFANPNKTSTEVGDANIVITITFEEKIAVTESMIEKITIADVNDAHKDGKVEVTKAPWNFVLQNAKTILGRDITIKWKDDNGPSGIELYKKGDEDNELNPLTLTKDDQEIIIKIPESDNYKEFKMTIKIKTTKD